MILSMRRFTLWGVFPYSYVCTLQIFHTNECGSSPISPSSDLLRATVVDEPRHSLSELMDEIKQLIQTNTHKHHHPSSVHPISFPAGALFFGLFLAFCIHLFSTTAGFGIFSTRASFPVLFLYTDSTNFGGSNSLHRHL